MKKVSAILLAFLMILTLLAGCGSKTEEAAAPSEPEQAPVEDAAPSSEPASVNTTILKEADDKMINTYTLLAVNPDAPFADADGNPVEDVSINTAGAEALIDWLLTEESLELLREKRIRQCRFEFHADLSFDEAVERLEKFDPEDQPFVPCEVRRYGEKRICFRVFDRFFFRTDERASLSVLMEGTDGLGVDILAVASGSRSGLSNDRFSGVNLAFVEELKRHMGLDVPKAGIKEKLRRYFKE